ncbi:MAG: SDR family oxidoreductase [Propionibacteriaceae bacterium]|jgi:NADP-dependent 3-hydroxy acid dehydrogenase YdfG|nr:SDR family oxidoreductase [Propionibacteriaceae bacterium]
MTDRTGQVALVTGGSQGVGRATVAALARRGLHVAAIAAAAGPEAGEILPVAADVASEAAVQAAVAETLDRFGRLDVVINCAGVSMNARRRLEDTSTDEWRRLVDTNLTGVYLVCRTVLPHLKDRGGYLINVLGGGAADFTVGAGSSLYTATKFAVRALSEALVAEFRNSAVRTSWVSPGQTDTSIWDHKLAPPSAEARSLMLRPEDVADVFLWLLDRPSHLHVPSIRLTPWTGI